MHAYVSTTRLKMVLQIQFLSGVVSFHRFKPNIEKKVREGSLPVVVSKKIDVGPASYKLKSLYE